eukprot:scaffold65824_cov69-Phaeocystis_antarctica.AAC.4
MLSSLRCRSRIWSPVAVESETFTVGTSPWIDHATSCCEPPSHPAVAAVTSEIAGGVRPWSMGMVLLTAHTSSAVLDMTCTR